MKKKILVFLALCLMMLTALPLAALGAEEEQEPEAKVISRGFTFTRGGSETNALYSHDGNYVSYNTYKPGDVLTVKPKGGQTPIGSLFFYLGSDDAQLTLRQYDRQGELLLSVDMDAPSLCCAAAMEPGCASVEIAAREKAFDLCEMVVLGEGRLPDSLPQMEAPVERADLLIVSTHPDDEWIFLGGVYPIYAGERGYTATFAYVTRPSVGRVHEAINSVWSANMRTMPYFLGFPDIHGSQPASKKAAFKAEEVTLALVRLYRKIKPLVVVTQDLDGEYGHWQHVVTAKSVLEAATLAQDETYDPDSAAEWGVWIVKKVYHHLAENGRIMLDVDEPLAAYQGKTAFQVAQRAFEEDKSQHRYTYRPTRAYHGIMDMRRFGLTFTTVGPDEGSDMFEHIQEDQLAKVILSATPTPAPTPEPTATPTPTPEPTATPAPTAAPTATPEPTPTPTLAPTAAPTATTAPQAPAGGNVLPYVVFVGGILLGIGISCTLIRRKRTARR